MNQSPAPPKQFMTLAGLAVLGLLLIRFTAGPGSSDFLRRTGGIVLILSGPLMIAPLFMVKAGGMTPLVDTGIYSLVRHPQYLGYMGFSIGFSLMSQHGAGYGLALCATVFFALQARAEERQLVEVLPGYAAYCGRVPRFNMAAGLWRRMRHG